MPDRRTTGSEDKKSRKVVTISRDFRDPASRREAIELINSADKEILLIAGKLSAYRFLDLRDAAESAVDKGLSVKVYACSPDQDIINRMLYKGIEVYLLPQKTINHNMIVDDISYMKTVLIKGKAYVRKYVNDPKGAQKLKAHFKSLMDKAKKAEIKGEDPLIYELKHPINWGVKTDASKIHEYFG